MNVANEEFRRFNKFLDDSKFVFSTMGIRENIQTLENEPDAARYDEEHYEKIFANYEKKELVLSNFKQNLITTRNKIDDMLNEITNVESSILRLKAMVNNQNLRSGLQGLMKKTIRKQLNIDDDDKQTESEKIEIIQKSINNLPEPLAYFLAKDVYVDAPRRKGGRKSNKRIKNRKTVKIHKK